MPYLQLLDPEVRQVWKSPDLMGMVAEFITMPTWEEVEFYYVREVKVVRRELITYEQLDQSRRREIDIFLLTHTDGDDNRMLSEHSEDDRISPECNEDYGVIVEPSLEPFSANYTAEAIDYARRLISKSDYTHVKYDHSIINPSTHVNNYIDRIMIAIDTLLPTDDEISNPPRLPYKILPEINKKALKSKGYSKIDYGSYRDPVTFRVNQASFMCTPQLNHVDEVITRLTIYDNPGLPPDLMTKKIQENLLDHRKQQLSNNSK